MLNTNEIIGFFLLIAICYIYARIDCWAVDNRSMKNYIVLAIHSLSTATLFASIIAMHLLLDVIFCSFYFVICASIWLIAETIRTTILKKDIFA